MKSRKVVSILGALVMSVSILSGCGSNENAATAGSEATGGTAAVSTEGTQSAEAASQTDEAMVFTVGFDAEFPPYGYRDENGEYVGFDLDLAAEVCNRNGWELVKQPIDWDAKVWSFLQGPSAVSGMALL